ncbi:MAG TPA: hypothetical protein GYA08_04150 [Chloroflexi bacterium]|nr:hypothetical protein [Chloroflexota bacterium]
MASSTPNVILLQVNGLERPVFEKNAGNANIKPGHLLAISNGEVIPHATAAAAVVKMVAIEHGFRNTSGTTLNIETAYADGDAVPFVYPQAGDLVYMVLKSGENVAAGALLEAANGGEVRAYTTGYIIGAAEEAANATAAAVRIKVRIA